MMNLKVVIWVKSLNLVVGKNLIDDLNILMNWVFEMWMKSVEFCVIFH